MKKIIMLVLGTILLVGCNKDVDLVGKWTANDGSYYQFNADGTCLKVMTFETKTCTYTKNNGVVDISFSNNTTESGQINKHFIIVGSDLYEKDSN